MAIKPRKYWENGTPLSRAFIDYYGHPTRSGELDKNHYANLLKPARDGEAKPDDPNFYAYSPKADFHREPLRNDYRNKFCLDLLNQLRTGQLIATGKQSSPERKSDIDKIPTTQIPLLGSGSRDVDGLPINDPICNEWDRDEFFGIAAHYREVRISDPTKNPDGTDKRTSIPKSRNSDGTIGREKPGRPSKQDLIEDAYKVCREAGLINPKGSQQDAIKAVQKYIAEHPQKYGDGRAGYSKNAIARAIAKHFNKLKL